MFPRVSLAVLAFALLSGSSAQAGLMIGGAGESIGLGGTEPTASQVLDLLTLDQHGGTYQQRLEDVDNSLAAVTPPPTVSGATPCALIGLSPSLAGPLFRWAISIGNSLVPASPVLDGLLKPS